MMNIERLDSERADHLMSELFSNPEQFNKKGLGNELLKHFFRGYSLERLRSLINAQNDEVIKAGIWIASELSSQASALLDDVIAVSKHSSRYIRYYALDVIMLGTSSCRTEEFSLIVDALDDPDPVVAERAVFLLSRANRGQLLSAARKFENAGDAYRANGVRLLLETQAINPVAIEVLLRSEDSRDRKLGLAVSERIYSQHPHLLHLAAASEDSFINSLATHLLSLRTG